MKTIIFTKIIIALSFLTILLTGTGCSSKDGSPKGSNPFTIPKVTPNEGVQSDKTTYALQEYTIIRDLSGSNTAPQEFDADRIFKSLVTTWDLKETQSAIVFRTASCGEALIPKFQTVRLPASSGVLGSNAERRKALGNFLVKGQKNMEELGAENCDQGRSNIHRALVHLVEQFDTNSGKTLIIFSDMAEFSSAGNMVQFYQNPSQLLSKYDQIVKILEADVKMPSLQGADVVIISPGDTETALWTSRFWTKYLESKGANVTVRASF